MGFLIIFILAVVAFLPALVWLLFFIREDVRSEPRRLIVYTFLVGGLAAIPTLALQIIFKGFVDPSYVIITLIGLAVMEEAFKFLAAYYAVNESSYFDEPIDSMIYMIAAASGMATFENILIALGSVDDLTFSAIYSASNVLLLRFVGATLLHILTSAIVGYYWARARSCFGAECKRMAGDGAGGVRAARIKLKTNYGLVLCGIVLATLLHTLFNYFVAVFQENSLIYSSVVLIVAAFFVLSDFEALRRRGEVEYCNNLGG